MNRFNIQLSNKRRASKNINEEYEEMKEENHLHTIIQRRLGET